MPFSPIQTAFTGGELSPRVRGRVDAEVYRKGLSECTNFEILPQGPLRKRAGAQFIGDAGALGAARLIPFRAAGSADDYCLVLVDGKLQVYSATTGARVSFATNLVYNGHFDSGAWGYGWDTSTSGGGLGLPTGENEKCKYGVDIHGIKQDITALTVVGRTYRLRFKARATVNAEVVWAWITDGLAEGDVSHQFAQTLAEQEFTADFVAARGIDGKTWVTFSRDFVAPPTGYFYIDDVIVTEVGAANVDELTAAWAEADLPGIQFAPELAKNRMWIVHGDLPPQVVVFTSPDVWEVYEAMFVSKPAEWRAGNYPSIVETGFQGRSWLAATGNEPATVWFSKSGAVFDFTPGVTASDSSSFVVSTKGALRWLQGRQVLLAGDEVTEHSISGSSQVITPTDINVRDESSFGSAEVQGVDIGDQAMWVTRDGRHVRAIGYSLQEDAWISRAVTFLAEHITEGGIISLAFARSPYSAVFARVSGILTGKSVPVCTYDRGEQVVAWGHWTFAGWGSAPTPYNADIAILETDNGAEVWIGLFQPGFHIVIHRIPLHETGRQYLDSWISGTKASANSITGLDHLEGATVSVLMDGALMASTYLVAGGAIASVGLFTGTTFIVGLPYTATAVTMPLEAGIPRGTAQGAKRRFARIAAILNDSALPKVNGVRLSVNASASSYTGVYSAAPPGGWETEGVITLEADLPARTEVLALLGKAQTNEV